MNRFVPAFGTADRPRTSDVALLRRYRVVAPFAKGRPDRMDRRKVENVETHFRDARQLRFDVAKRAGGTRKELVPGAERRAAGIDFNRQLAAIASGELVLRVARHQFEQLVIRERVNFVARVVITFDDGDVMLEPLAIAILRAFRGGADHLQPDAKLNVEIGV